MRNSKSLLTLVFATSIVHRNEHITPYRLELGWLTISARTDYFAANLLRRLFNTATPSYLLAFFNFRFTNRPVRGNVAVLDISSCITETLKRSFHNILLYILQFEGFANIHRRDPQELL